MKISTANKTELFETFQSDMQKMTQDMYASSYPNSPEPIFFIATTNSATKLMLEKHPELAASIQMASDNIMPYDENDEKLSVLGIPLGPFFHDTGDQKMNYYGKVIARASIWKAIQMFNEVEEGGALFVAFISECWVRALNQNNLTDAEIEYIQNNGVAHLNDDQIEKKEAVVMLFESYDGQEGQIYLDIERNHEDGHQFIYRRDEDKFFQDNLGVKAGEAKTQSRGGLFSGFFEPFDPAKDA